MIFRYITMDQSDSVAIFVLFSSNKQRKIRGRKEMEITAGEFIISFLFLLFFFYKLRKNFNFRVKKGRIK